MLIFGRWLSSVLFPGAWLRSDFCIRDVYATIIVVTFSLVVLENSRIDPAYLVPFSPVVALCGIISAGALVGVRWHFSRHYTTILLRENNGFCWLAFQLRQDWRREDARQIARE